MASHKSAEKRARQTERRTAVNTNRRSRMRGSVKKVEEAIASGDKKAAMAALRAAQPDIQRGAAARVVAPNAAARRVSRLNARIKAMSWVELSLLCSHERRSHERRFLFVARAGNFQNFFSQLSRRSFGPDIGEQHTIRVYRSSTERER